MRMLLPLSHFKTQVAIPDSAKDFEFGLEARQSQIEAKRPYDRAQPQVGLSEEEDRFDEVAARPNSKALTDSGIPRQAKKKQGHCQ